MLTVFVQSVIATVCLLGFIVMAWVFSLTPLAVAYALSRPINAPLAENGLRVQGGVSWPRLRLWRGTVGGRAAFARLTLRRHLGPSSKESALTIGVAAEVRGAWLAHPDQPAPEPVLRAPIETLAAATGTHWWEVRIVPGWVCIGIDPLTSVWNLDTERLGSVLTELATLATAIESASVDIEADELAWRPEGWAMPGWLVWSSILFLPMLVTLCTAPILIGSIGLGFWGAL